MGLDCQLWLMRSSFLLPSVSGGIKKELTAAKKKVLIAFTKIFDSMYQEIIDPRGISFCSSRFLRDGNGRSRHSAGCSNSILAKGKA